MFALYTISGGIKSYVRATVAPALEFSEHPRDAIVFASKEEADGYLAARPVVGSNVVVMCGPAEAPGLPYHDRSDNAAAEVETVAAESSSEDHS